MFILVLKLIFLFISQQINLLIPDILGPKAPREKSSLHIPQKFFLKIQWHFFTVEHTAFPSPKISYLKSFAPKFLSQSSIEQGHWKVWVFWVFNKNINFSTESVKKQFMFQNLMLILLGIPINISKTKNVGTL